MLTLKDATTTKNPVSDIRPAFVDAIRSGDFKRAQDLITILANHDPMGFMMVMDRTTIYDNDGKDLLQDFIDWCNNDVLL